ncbi:hypothetical protein [Streptomyces caelestis]|uniref:hypothetical protein n=1 Tax=Streptomyces caelestis TaxID=36816 RepID=UPI003668A0C4
MLHAGGAARTDYAEAAAELALRVLRALDGAEDPDPLAGYVDAAADPKAALAAVRVLGADVLAAHVLTGRSLTQAEAETVAEAARVFPLAAACDPDTAHITRWRDWAIAQAAARCGLPVPGPPRPDYVGLASPVDACAWRCWSVTMAQLSTLALPGLDSALHEAARQGAVPLAQGSCWAILRRDYALAARLSRWLALVHGQGAAVPLDPAPLLDHLLLFGGVEARTVLEAEIARRLLKGSHT